MKIGPPCFTCHHYTATSSDLGYGVRACRGGEAISPVTDRPREYTCESMRADRGACGPDAKLWKPITPDPGVRGPTGHDEYIERVVREKWPERLDPGPTGGTGSA